ncbi:MAG: TRAP transporter small permease subunit [Spirochaetaceae bacterium]|jgi:TRAP-type C4-dicarboxylate transport system permease small subunit|nr:TRAP transporter small permease subunit [Spirochaetaceae bacterium]
MVRSIAKAADRVLTAFACVFVCAFCATVIIQIVCRSIPFLPIPSWTEELARYYFIYAVACAAGPAVRANSFVAVDILTGFMPRQSKRFYTIVLNGALCAFAVFFETKCAVRFAFLRARMVSTAMEIPMQWIYFALVILFGMLSLMYALEIISLCQDAGAWEGEEEGKK